MNVNVFNYTCYDIRLKYFRYFLSNIVKVTEIEGEVNLLFSDDDYIKKLNKQFRNKDKATDVLTFPSGSAKDGGDIIISYEWVLSRYKKEIVDKVIIKLIVHSILHLQGIHHTYSRESLKENYSKMRELYKKTISYIKLYKKNKDNN